MSCKQRILALDQLEEIRTLSQSEFSIRQWCREKAYGLATIIEIRWQQRARCRGLAEGDNNTRFFHSYASSRLRTNTVQAVMVDGQQITEAGQIRYLFRNHMKSILGTRYPVDNFEPAALYEVGPDLWELQNPFTEHEIETTVFNLANNRASGPDGLPNEFAKTY